MQTRTFVGRTLISDERLALALAPALTPSGLDNHPSFFHGFATYPQVLARGLVVLADISATRYDTYVPTDQRDPVLSAHGDRLRAECFSACNGVYARLDLLAAGLDGGEIGFGTTNVDIGGTTRKALVAIARDELMHLDVGDAGLRVASLDSAAAERPVAMPERWVRALGNVAELHHRLDPVFTVDRAGTRAFIAGLPAATSRAATDGAIAPTRGGVQVRHRATAGSVQVMGLHRLSALTRVMTSAESMTVYAAATGNGSDDADGTDAAGGRGAPLTLFELQLPGARLSIGLTAQTWRGFSGEGALLPSLAGPDAIDDAERIAELLAFEPMLDIDRLGRDSALPPDRVTAAIAVLAASGRIGWDAHDRAWFHRELPHDRDRVDRDNPRLVAARALVEEGAVRRTADGGFTVRSDGTSYRVVLGASQAACACAWYLRHRDSRGPCKHVIAAEISAEGER